MQDSAVASRVPALAAQLEHDLGNRPLVLREEVRRERRAQRRGQRLAALFGARLDDEVDVDLEVASADRRLDAVTVAACVRERLRHGGLARPEQAQDVSPRRGRPPEHRAERLARDRRGPQPPELSGRAGKHDVHAALALQHEPRSRPCHADHLGAVRHRRLLRHAGGEVRVRPAEALRDRPRETLDLPLELLVDAEGNARDARDELDRAVVVRRPEPARDEAHLRLAGCRERRLEVVGVVSDDQDPVRDEAQRERLLRVERPVPVGALAAHELAARDDDRRARAAHPETAVAPAAFSVPPGPSSTPRPSTLTTTFRGRSTETNSAFFVNRWNWPFSSVPL